MNGLYNSLPITGVARTITDIMGIGAPRCAGLPISVVSASANAAFRGGKADRVFMYNPDAVALWLFQKYTVLFEDAFLHSDIQVPT